MSSGNSSSASSESSSQRRKVKARQAKPQKLVDIVNFPDPVELDEDFEAPEKISSDEVVSSGSSSESRKALASSEGEVELGSESELDEEWLPYDQQLSVFAEPHLIKCGENLLKTFRKQVGKAKWEGQHYVEDKNSKRKNTGEWVGTGIFYDPVPLKKFTKVDESELVEAILDVTRKCFFDPPSKKVPQPKRRIIKKKSSGKALKRSLSDREESESKRQSTSSDN